MIRLRATVLYAFARNRRRREIAFDPKFKQFADIEEVKLQEEELRHKFENAPRQTLSNALEEADPKPGQKFFVDKKTLSKKMKQAYKEKITLENLRGHDSQDFDYLADSKSHLFNQQEQIQFEEKFKQQLFRTKETKRLVTLKENQVEDYLPGRAKDQEFLEYSHAKNQLKNKKIQNMMSISRNNEQLQLLIQSGLFNDPANIQSLVQEIGGARQQTLLEGRAQQHSPSAVVEAVHSTAIEHEITDIGPEQLKEKHKVRQFIQNYWAQSEKDKQSCLEDLQLLNKIRRYEQKLFLSRYDAINFRFKGRVTFKFFKEDELVSYIKNEAIEPRNLLLMYKQNKNQISKFKTPIITPRVSGTIYAKTSQYKFPETDQNNRLNMINDSLFQSLERRVFRDIEKLNDAEFCSVVWSYARNHEDQQGALLPDLYSKIIQVIFKEVEFRIFNLSEEDLGLCLRSLCRLSLASKKQGWQEIVGYLGEKLPVVSNPYTLESIFQFLLSLSETPEVSDVVAKNITRYGSFKWQESNTVKTFVNSAALILKESKDMNKLALIKQSIKSVLVKAQVQLFNIIPDYSLNLLPFFLTVVAQSDASSSLPKLVNLCKKTISEKIQKQSELIKQHNLANIASSVALLDLQKYLAAKSPRFGVVEAVQPAGASMRKLCMRALSVLQPVPFNSQLYFVYHDLAKLMYSELGNLSNSVIAQTLEQLALVKYKNEKLVDDAGRKIIESFYSIERSEQTPARAESNMKKTRQLVSLCNSYALTKRQSEIRLEALELLMQKFTPYLIKESPNLLIRFVSGVISMQQEAGSETGVRWRSTLAWLTSKVLLPFIKSGVLIEEEIAAIAYSATMLDQYDLTLHYLEGYNAEKVADPISKFTIQMCLMIARLGQKKTISHQDLKNLAACQRNLYLLLNEELLYNETMIGSPLPQKQVQSKILEVLRKQHPQARATNWFIEVPDTKEIYFVATYDHLKVNSTPQSGIPVLELSGIWKLFQKYFQLSGRHTRVVVSFLEGR